METKYGFIIFHFQIIVFKSYYVVWKPEYFRIFCYEPEKFKSYYVVWKLFSLFCL